MKRRKPQPPRKLSPEAEIALEGLAQVEVVYTIPPEELERRIKGKPWKTSTQMH